MGRYMLTTGEITEINYRRLDPRIPVGVTLTLTLSVFTAQGDYGIILGDPS